MRFLALALITACTTSHGGTPDGRPSIDAGLDAPADSFVPTGGGAALTHTLFVNTEGVTLASTAEDDATQNQSSVVNATTPLAPWMMADAARATKIAALMTEVQTILAPYDVAVVNARPPSGTYDMMVITDDDATAIGLSAQLGGITPTTCNQVASVISMEFAPAYDGFTEQKLRDTFASYVIATFGLAAAVPTSTVDQDCMCYGAQSCQFPTAPCHIGGAGTAVDPNFLCTSPGATMDENALFLAAFGPHP